MYNSAEGLQGQGSCETFKATYSFTQEEYTIGTDLLALGEALFESDKRDKLMETLCSCGIQSGVF